MPAVIATPDPPAPTYIGPPSEQNQTALFLSWDYPVDNGAPVILYKVWCQDGSSYLSEQSNEVNYWKQPTIEYFLDNETAHLNAEAAGIDLDHYLVFGGLTAGTK